MAKKTTAKKAPAKKAPAKKSSPPEPVAEKPAPEKDPERLKYLKDRIIKDMEEEQSDRTDIKGLDIAATGADTQVIALLTCIDASLKVLAACVQQQTDPETGEPLKTWLKTREFG
ncbi:MAG: hypothetical protein PF904_10905 [Kiritimatiellae bacterium]|jgi:hypothetical protein|nr:hypothetical protein [Kiritimatiellia bacterium]